MDSGVILDFVYLVITELGFNLILVEELIFHN